MAKEERLFLAWFGFLLCLFFVGTSSQAWAGSLNETVLDPIVVTGKRDGEARSKSTATVMVIDEEQIKRSNSESITDLLANSGLAFLSQWTPGQTSINIRGGASDGQGKDFKSQVMVLINGRRAGTANISKLSPGEVKRIEVMRGPASVMYGSQAIGGIINIIMKDGRNTEGGLLDMRFGSSGLLQGHAEYALAWGENDAMALYAGTSWGRKDDYTGGKKAGTQVNTQWRRYSGLGNLNWRINQSNEVQLMLRSDGIYDAGFRGSGANRYAKEDRFNQSLDLTWQFSPEDLPVRWNLHNYLVYDEDFFKWASPKSGTSKDYNKRKLYIMGVKFQPLISLSDSNELLLGVDFEHSKLRSDRDRIGLTGNPMPVNPQDLNQTEKVWAFYAEDTQRFFNDRLTLRGGVRYTRGETSIDSTPNLYRQRLTTETYDKTTWSIGTNWEATDFLSIRAGAATGFRAPTATEMSGQVSFLNSPNEVTYGNKDIRPESNQQYEVGMFWHGHGWYADLAFYHNEIKDRIVRKRLNSKESKYVNNDGKIIMDGLEFDSRLNLDQLTDMGNWLISFGLNGSYNFKMKDEARKEKNRKKLIEFINIRALFILK